MKHALSKFIFLLTVVFASQACMASLMRALENGLIDVQVEAQVFQPPYPVTIEGKTYLTYEVFITNVGLEPVTLKSLSVLDPSRPKQPLFTYTGKDLAERLRIFKLSKTNAPLAAELLKPGTREVIYLMLEFKDAYEVPKNLIHQFVFQPEGQSKKSLTIVMAPVTAKVDTPIAVGKPLVGDKWMALNGPANNSRHRRSYFVVDGIMYFSERFAIDFMKLGPDGKLFKNKGDKNTDYYSYRENVYSVADGKVVAIKDNIPENIPGNVLTPVSLATVGGNYVVVDIGFNRYAYYAHFIPGSIKVKPGDRVKKGQVLGLLGNSGNSTAPHLHFHIVDAPSDLGANGMPYVFEQFTLLPIKAINEAAMQVETIDKPETYTNELVKDNAIVNFGK